MKANELMIGDWVIATNNGAVPLPSEVSEMLPKVGKVVGIDCDCVMLDFVDFGFMLDGIEPIPITTEILENNGFEKEEEWWHLKEKGKTIFMVMRRWDGKFVFSVSLNVPTIPSVHQLQHALRLCGIAKTIEL